MVYLVEDKEYLKIGFTDNLEARKKQYATCTLTIKWLDTFDGTKADETALHNICKDYFVQGEWFRNCDEVRNAFQNYKLLSEERIHKLKENKETISEIRRISMENLETFLIYGKFAEHSRNNTTKVRDILVKNNLDKYKELEDVKEIKKLFTYYENQKEILGCIINFIDFTKTQISDKIGIYGNFKTNKEDNNLIDMCFNTICETPD